MIYQTGTFFCFCSRFIAVCIPYRTSSIVTMKNAKTCVILTIIFSLLYNMPRYFESYLNVSYTNGTQSIGMVYTILGKSKIYKFVYFDILYYIFSFVLPLLLLIVLNTRLIIAYRAIQAKRAKMNLRQESDNNITLVMIIIILCFILSQSPARIVQVVWNYALFGCDSYQFYTREISTVLEVLNSSSNFFVYTALRKQFRMILISCLSSCCVPTGPKGFEPVSMTNNGKTVTTSVDDNEVADTKC